MARSLTLIAGLALGLAACDPTNTDEVKSFFLGTSMPASPTPAPSPSGVLGFGDAGKKAAANAELLHEVYQVVLDREPGNRSEFGNLVDSMNQGASIEGLYNGFTHSSDYRKMEMVNTGAPVQVLKAFSSELALLESELQPPTQFDAASAKPPAAFEMPTGSEPQVIEYGQKKPSPQGPSAELYGKVFVGASSFTLKRVLGEEALKVIASKKDYPEKLALWYSKWAVKMAERNVDFGIGLRNKADEAFHYKWALDAGQDRVTWEVLNRLHRILNQAGKAR